LRRSAPGWRRRAYIWQNRTKFDSIAVQLAPAARDLVAALQGGDMASIRDRAKALGEVCSSCHKSFRAD
jgi:cytochrome c556